MRVLFCTTTFGKANTGAGRFAQSIVKLSTSDPDVEVYILSEEIGHPDFNVQLSRSARIATLSYHAKSRLYSDAIERILQKHHVDVIFMNDAWLAANWLKRKRSIPVIVFVHDDNAMFPMHNALGAMPSMWMRRSLESYAVRKATSVLTNSEYMRSRLAARYRRARHEIGVIPLAFTDYANVLFQSKPIDPRKRIHILFIKNDIRRGNLLLLVQALLELKHFQFRLTIVGPEERIVTQAISYEMETGRNVEFVITGPVTDHAKVLRLMHGQHLFCVPAQREAFGIAYHEALVSGLPVIYHETGGIPREMRKYGFALAGMNVLTLAETIKKITQIESAVLERRVYSGRQWVIKNFSHAEMLQRLIHAVHSVTPQQNPSSSRPELAQK